MINLVEIGWGLRTAACGVAAILLSGAASAQPPYEDQVVALRVTRQSFDEDRPWTKKNPEVRDGTAVVVSDGLLLTEANIVEHATFIQVEKHGRADWIPARLVHADYEIDLALLSVDLEGFFDDLAPAEIAASATTTGVVRSVRWKKRQLEVSNSRPGRIEVRNSPFGSIHHAFLRLATDVSSGGWAEPVFADDKLIGITVAQSGQTATVIPAEILSAYVEDARRDGEGGAYRGFPTIGGLRWQHNTDSAQSRYLGLEGEPRGVVIRQVPWGSTGCSSLQPLDILLELDGHEIDASGNYHHSRYGQLRFDHLVVEGHSPGDVVSARILRDRRVLDVEIELRSYGSSARMIPWKQPDLAPPYLIAGGLVFRELDGSYLKTWGKDWQNRAPSQLLYLYDLRGSAQSPARRRIIVLSQVLPSAYNVGYHAVANILVKSINGFDIDSIADAEEAFENPRTDLHRVVFYPNTTTREIVLDATTFKTATQSILDAYDVPDRLRRRGRQLPDLGPHCPGNF